MADRANPERDASWAVVGAIIAGCLLVGAGIVADLLVLVIIGIVVIVAGGIGAVLLPRKGLSGPISMTAQHPDRTVGPRGDVGSHAPPIDTKPGTSARQARTTAPDLNRGRDGR